MELESQECSGSSTPLNQKVVSTHWRCLAATDNFRDFVTTEALKACIWYLLYDLCRYPFTVSSYKSMPPPDIFSDSLPQQAFFALMAGITNYCVLNLQYSAGSALAVATCLYTPQDWPPMMGRLSDVSSVRAFWGKFWHQNLRRVCNHVGTEIGKWLTVLTSNRNLPSHSISLLSISPSGMAPWCPDTHNYIWHLLLRLQSIT